MNLKRATFERYARGTSPFVGVPVDGVGTIVFLRRHLQAALETHPNRIIYNQDTKTVTFKNHRSVWRLNDLLGQQKFQPWQIRQQLESWARAKQSSVRKRKETVALGQEGRYVRRLREAVAKLKKQRDKIYAHRPSSPINPTRYKESGDYTRKQCALWIAQKPIRKALAKLAGQKLVHGEPKTWADFYKEVERITGSAVAYTFARVHARKRFRHGLPEYPSRETYLKHLPQYLVLSEKPYEWRPFDLFRKEEYGEQLNALERHAAARLEYCAALRERKSIDSQIENHLAEIASVTKKESEVAA